MREHFDAGSPAAADDQDPLAVLTALADRVEGAEADALLDQVAELTDRIGDILAAEPLSATELAALEAVTGADDAPLAFGSLHRRVHAGVLTWDDFWARPSAEGPVGSAVVAAVLEHITAGPAREAEGRDG